MLQFPDVRAALAVSLYAQGLTAEAETNWGRVEVTDIDIKLQFCVLQYIPFAQMHVITESLRDRYV